MSLKKKSKQLPSKDLAVEVPSQTCIKSIVDIIEERH